MMIFRQTIYENDENDTEYEDGYRLTLNYDHEDCEKVTINEVTLQHLIDLVESELEWNNRHREIDYTNKLIDEIMDEVGVTITKQIIWNWISNGGLNL